MDTEEIRNSLKFVCELCGKSYGLINTLNRHLRYVHNKEKPFSCEFCILKFAQETDMRKHVRGVHDNERPHMCASCGFRFKCSASLFKHNRTIHGRHHAGGSQPYKRKERSACKKYQTFIEAKEKEILLNAKENSSEENRPLQEQGENTKNAESSLQDLEGRFSPTFTTEPNHSKVNDNSEIQNLNEYLENWAKICQDDQEAFRRVAQGTDDISEPKNKIVENPILSTNHQQATIFGENPLKMVTEKETIGFSDPWIRDHSESRTKKRKKSESLPSKNVFKNISTQECFSTDNFVFVPESEGGMINCAHGLETSATKDCLDPLSPMPKMNLKNKFELTRTVADFTFAPKMKTETEEQKLTHCKDAKITRTGKNTLKIKKSVKRNKSIGSISIFQKAKVNLKPNKNHGGFAQDDTITSSEEESEYFSFNQTEQSKSFSFDQSEQRKTFSFDQSESRRSSWLRSPPAKTSFVTQKQKQFNKTSTLINKKFRQSASLHPDHFADAILPKIEPKDNCLDCMEEKSKLEQHIRELKLKVVKLVQENERLRHSVVTVD